MVRNHARVRNYAAAWGTGDFPSTRPPPPLVVLLSNGMLQLAVVCAIVLLPAKRTRVALNAACAMGMLDVVFVVYCAMDRSCGNFNRNGSRMVLRYRPLVVLMSYVLMISAMVACVSIWKGSSVGWLITAVCVVLASSAVNIAQRGLLLKYATGNISAA